MVLDENPGQQETIHLYEKALGQASNREGYTDSAD
jgi:hypothetical protein